MEGGGGGWGCVGVKLLAQYVAWLVAQKQLIVLSASLSSAANGRSDFLSLRIN